MRATTPWSKARPRSAAGSAPATARTTTPPAASARARAAEPAGAAVRLSLRHQDPHRLRRSITHERTFTTTSPRRPSGSGCTSACRSWTWSRARRWTFPTPKNLNYWWTFGGILAVMLVVQIVTGIVLAMHYTPHVDMAFASVEHIMRDVNYGWLLRYMHANGASMFFIAVYIHIFRGLYYGSYKAPREVLWMIGVLIYLADDGHRLHGLRAALGPDELLGRQGHHQPVLGHSRSSATRSPRWLWGGFCGRQPDAEPLLLAALPAALRDRRPRRPAHLGAARAGQQQPDRRLGEEQRRTRCPSTPTTR